MAEVSLIQRVWRAFEEERGYSNVDFNGKRLKQEENEKLYRSSFYQKVFPETQNILRHIRGIGFLRPPQVDAFELYVYLKEIRNNPTIPRLYWELFTEKELLLALGYSKEEAFDLIDNKQKVKQAIKNRMVDIDYPNWLFALAMGTGKTILLATMIFYDFILSRAYPQDNRFAKNALVFAPDTTVIDSLREIKEFDHSRVVPAEYATFLTSNLKFHYLSDIQTELSVLKGSTYNIIVSNVQKIILKKIRKQQKGLFPIIKNVEGEWKVNDRLKKLEQMENLSIFVDEAHHSFGKSIAEDLKRVRETINRLHRTSPLAGCINLTGTPYIEGRMLPEVVYFYSLKKSIDDGHLKEVKFIDYSQTKTEEFIQDVVERFMNKYGENRRENLLPKIAVYCTTIKELEEKFRPMLEKILAEKKISLEKVLVNHSKVPEENIRQFRLLDTPESDKQFILLVGKGTEGWNCRSLFACAMYRRPKSKVLLLQASMRCLRSIGDMPQTASVFLSAENCTVLEKEVKKNLGTTIGDLQKGTNRKRITINKLKDKKIKLAKKRVKVSREERVKVEKINFALKKYYQDHKEEFEAIAHERELEEIKGKVALEIREVREIHRIQKEYTIYTLIEEVSRFTHLSCIKSEAILKESKEGLKSCLKWVNEENLLIAEIIRKILEAVYEYKSSDEIEWEEINLAKNFPMEWTIEDDTLMLTNGKFPKSFHIDHYLFDSGSEKTLFEFLLGNDEIEEVYFTGGITDTNHNEFYVEYYDKLEERWRKYYPDFFFKLKGNGWRVCEVKQAGQKDHPRVKAQESYARELFEKLNSINYVIKTDDAIGRGNFTDLFK